MINVNTEMKNEAQYIKKSVDIMASDDQVWGILTSPKYTSKWANAFYEGTVVDSDWMEGSAVIWKTPDGQTAAEGKVQVNYVPRLLKVAYVGENKDERGNDLGEYIESYSLLEKEGKTTLTIESGPLKENDIQHHAPLWDSAINRIKQLAEEL